MRRFILTTLAVLFFPVFGHADICSDLVAAFPKLVGGKPLVSSVTHSSYKSLFDNCDSHDQFAGHKLPSHNGKQLKCSNDPNHVGYLLKYSDGTISFSAKAGVDADGSKFSCGAGWPNQCGTWLEFDQGSDRKDVNAEDTPFVVVPSKMPSTGISFQRDSKIGKGDLAIAFKNGKCSLGVVGDAGPYFRLGEISLKSHVDLGHDRCKKAGQYPCQAVIESSISSDVNYIIFPQSRPKPLTSQNVDIISRSELEKRIKSFIASYAH